MVQHRLYRARNPVQYGEIEVICNGQIIAIPQSVDKWLDVL